MSEDGLSVQEQEVKFRPIKLRRTHNQQSIEENLKTLAQNKKRVAQEKYYGNAGQSPLTRFGADVQLGYKPPVHQRLGNRQTKVRRNLRTIPNNGLTTGRLRLRRTNPTMPNGIAGVKRNCFKRTNSVQQRLYRIRQNQMMQTPQLRTKLLRHKRADVLPFQPTNLTVQVDNTNFKKQSVAVVTHSVHGSLNQQLRSEIQVIQSHSKFTHEFIAAEPIFVPGIGVTGIFINDRFSRLP